jgi:HSA
MSRTAIVPRAMQVLPPFPEPKRGKLHWDYLLEEMKWMSAEFARCATPCNAQAEVAQHPYSNLLRLPCCTRATLPQRCHMSQQLGCRLLCSWQFCHWAQMARPSATGRHLT